MAPCGVLQPGLLWCAILEQSNNFISDVGYYNFIECQDHLFCLGGQVTVGSDRPSAAIQSQFLMRGTRKDLSSAA